MALGTCPKRLSYVAAGILLLAGCGEPMQFEKAGSKRTLAEDQQACDQEMQSPKWAQYVTEAKGRLDPWQVCIERKGWKRVDRPLSELARKQL